VKVSGKSAARHGGTRDPAPAKRLKAKLSNLLGRLRRHDLSQKIG
jgi:hypothetical protein